MPYIVDRKDEVHAFHSEQRMPHNTNQYGMHFAAWQQEGFLYTRG